MKNSFAPFRFNAVYGCLLACFLAPSLQANPNSPTVAAGQATFTQQGQLLTVRNTPGAIINWQQFSIGPGETTRFQQQSAASSVLNRVAGQDPSRILGALQSNGRVYLINPNGIVFGQGAKIDVGGLIASSLNISDADFKAGKYRFEAGNVAGSIHNLGTLSAGNKGNIYLIAPEIENSGIINAPNGQVLLAAGRSVQLVDIGSPNLRIEISAPDTQAINLGKILAQSGSIGLYGASLRNQGTISADAAVVGDGGKIIFKALQGNALLESGSRLSANGRKGGNITLQAEQGDTLIHDSTLSATGSNGKGGNIALLGQRVGLDGATTANASGHSGGGSVLVGGDYRGSNAAVQNATETRVEGGVRLKADATGLGDGGKIILWSDGTTTASGEYSVRGGVSGGNGGLIETSGKHLRYNAKVDLAAPRGKAGTWLLDPSDLVIDGGNNQSAPDTVYETDLEAVSAGTIFLSANNTVSLGATPFTSGLTLQSDVSLDIQTTGGVGDITLTNLPIQASGIIGGIISINATGSSGILRVGNMSAANQINLIGNDVALSGSISGGNSVNISARGSNGIHPDGPSNYLINGGNVTLAADKIRLYDPLYGGSINPGIGATVWLKPQTAGLNINLGTDSTTLDGNLNIGSLDIGKIAFLTNSTLKIGDATAGNINVTASVAPSDSELNTLLLIAGGTGGISATSGGLSLTSAISSSLVLDASAGPIAFLGSSSINNSTPGGSIILRSTGNIAFGTGVIQANTGGIVDIAAGGAIQGSTALIKGWTVKAVAANGIDLQTQDITYLAAKNTTTGDLLIRDTPSNPSSPNPGALSIIYTLNDDSTTLSGLNNLAPNGNVTLKSGRPITVDTGDGDSIQISATRTVDLVSQGATAALSTINFTPGVGSVTVQAPEVKLRANNLFFSGATVISGTGATGFVSLASPTTNGAIEIFSGSATSSPALGIDKSLLSFIQSPYVGFGSTDALLPSGSLLINTALTTGDFGGSLLGLSLMSGGGTISQSPGATLTVPNLIIGGGAGVSLNEANMVGRLMARLTGGTALNFRNAQSLDIGRFVPGGIEPPFEGVSTQNGNIALNVTGNLNAPDASLGITKEIDAGTADINLTTTGNMALRGVNGNRVQLNAGGNIGGFVAGSRGKITGNILAASANGTQGVLLDTDVSRLNVSAANGNIDIIEANDVAIGSVSTPGDFTILSTGNIFDDNAVGALNVAARNLNAKGSSVSLDTVISQSARIEGTGTGNANIVRLYDLGAQAAAPLNVTAISAGNPIDISAQRTITADATGPSGGNIRLRTSTTAGALPSDIRLGQVRATAGNVSIEAAGAIIDGNDTTGAVLNVEAAKLNLLATSGIGAGNPLETRVGKFAAESAAGNIEITNVGSVDISKALLTGSGPGDFLFDNTGAVTISGPIDAKKGRVSIAAHSPILIASTGSISALGNINLSTADDGSPGDTITLDGNLTSQQGNITLLANDSILQSGSISTLGSGTVSLKSTAGAIQMAPSASISTVGGVINCDANGDIILSQLSTGSTGSVSVTTLTGTIGSSTTGNNITTGSMLLAAAKGISGVGFTAKTTDVSSTSGYVTVTNTNTGAVISNDPAINPPPPPETTGTVTDQVEQTLNSSILTSINLITSPSGENIGDLPLAGGGKDKSDPNKDEEGKKGDKETQKDTSDGTTKKARLSVCN